MVCSQNTEMQVIGTRFPFPGFGKYFSLPHSAELTATYSQRIQPTHRKTQSQHHSVQMKESKDRMSLERLLDGKDHNKIPLTDWSLNHLSDCESLSIRSHIFLGEPFITILFLVRVCPSHTIILPFLHPSGSLTFVSQHLIVRSEQPTWY